MYTPNVHILALIFFVGLFKHIVWRNEQPNFLEFSKGEHIHKRKVICCRLFTWTIRTWSYLPINRMIRSELGCFSFACRAAFDRNGLLSEPDLYKQREIPMIMLPEWQSSYFFHFIHPKVRVFFKVWFYAYEVKSIYRSPSIFIKNG